MVFRSLLEKIDDAAPGFANSSPQILEFRFEFFIFSLFYGGDDRRLNAGQAEGYTVRHKFGLTNAALATFTKIYGLLYVLKKAVHDFATLGGLSDRFRGSQNGEQTLLCFRIVKPVERLFKAVLGDSQADLSRCDGFDSVRFVEDNKVVRKQVTGRSVLHIAHAFQSQEKEGVVYHDNVRS